MVKEMSQRSVNKALKDQGCQVEGSGRGRHTKWRCPCGQHTALIPRHNDISPGVVTDTIKRMQCLPEGWLQ